MLRTTHLSFLFFLIIFLICSICYEAKANTLTLAPVAAGTWFGRSGSNNTYGSLPDDIRVYSNWDYPHPRYYDTGVIEFDISSLSSLVPGTFTADLMLSGVVYSSESNQSNALQVFDTIESAEDGNIFGGGGGSLIGNLFIPYHGSNFSSSIDVTMALENDLLNLSTNTFSGFGLKWERLESYWVFEFATNLVYDTPRAIFLADSENAPKLIITSDLTITTTTTTTSSTTTTTVPCEKKKPKILKLSKTKGIAGDVITITGKNFCDVVGQVVFGSTNAVSSDWSNQSLTVTVPDITAGKKGEKVLIKIQSVNGKSSNPKPFKVLP